MRFHRKSRSRVQRKFAWLPKKLDNGTTVWLEFYTRWPRYYGEKR
ncbi:hypothetical protein [Stakelama pacifica]|uniref:Uncharacterized protein n=1 Tax=Stakelama pacifica TaxID=517720 RepID=A0A4R6FN88_9SPHN|nr:hypothetical protein [Stakelama pacifica]TDN83013.1 hypothetical protein EV664_105211 [Stakelama pacifica]